MCARNEPYTCASGSRRKKAEWERAVRTSRKKKKKLRRAVICVDRYLLWFSYYAGGRPDICMRNWRWHKGMNLLTRGRTREQDAGIKWGLPYAIVRGQGSAVSPCWHVDTYHLYLIMSAEDSEQASERAACKRKTESHLALPVHPVIHRFARHSRSGTRQIERVSRDGI